MKAFLIGFLLLLFIVPQVSAQEELKIDGATITTTPVPEINYTLPYPGILPDNPLYALKAARDRVVSFFISDPLKKAEFDLLQADKRVQAGLFLLHKENPDVSLAITTISKGQNYLDEAIVSAAKVKQQKDMLTDFPARLATAAKKHRELLKKEAPRIKGEEKKDFDILLKRADGFVTRTEKAQKTK